MKYYLKTNRFFLLRGVAKYSIIVFMSVTHLGSTQFASGNIEAIRCADGGEESGGHLLGFLLTSWLVISNKGTQTSISVPKNKSKILACA